MAVFTQELFTLRFPYILLDCRPIREDFERYFTTLRQRGYNLLIDTPTAFKILQVNAVGFEPLQYYRFGAVALVDSPLVRDVTNSRQDPKTLKDLIEKNAAELDKAKLGTVIMELVTLSHYVMNYADSEVKDERLISIYRMMAFKPDSLGSDSLMKHWKDTKFIQGVEATYYPGLDGIVAECNLYLERLEGSKQYSKEELQKVVSQGSVIKVLKIKEGSLQENFPDKAVVFSRKTAEEAHNALDVMVKLIHGIGGVVYWPLPVKTSHALFDFESFRIKEMVVSSGWHDFPYDEDISKAQEAKKRGEVATLRDLGVSPLAMPFSEDDFLKLLKIYGYSSQFSPELLQSLL